MNTKKWLAVAILLVGGVTGALLFLEEEEEREVEAGPSPSTASAESLIQTHCSRCHQAPEPHHLPKEAWPFAIRWMGNYLGIEDQLDGHWPLVVSAYIPAKPMVHPDDLARIEAYFIEKAPPASEMTITRARAPVTQRFTPRRTNWSDDIPLVTLVHVDETRQRVLVGGYGQFGVCTGGPTKCGPKLRSHMPSGQLDWEHRFISEPIHVENRHDGYRVTVIGAFRQDRGTAQIADLNLRAPGLAPIQRTLLAGGHRLTEHFTGDMDGDGRHDIVSVGFGDGYGPSGLGSVSVLWSTAQFNDRYLAAGDTMKDGVLPGALISQVLMQEAGPLNAEVKDFDGDGLRDILLARAQGAQQLVFWRNQGDRSFSKSYVKQWFVGFGLNCVKAADFDGDGDLDLLVVSGNNMEFPEPPLRPYHGLRILENTGNMQFKDRYHFPLYGALDAVVADFDNDGDPDVAAIALFLHWEDPESFIYLENKGDYSFEASGLGQGDFGRWLSIAAGDVTGDGAPDIVLGSARTDLALAENGPEHKLAQKAPSVMVLENNP